MADGAGLIEIAKKIKEEMKDFYISQSKSEIDFQKTIKDRGFSYLAVNCQDRETIVEIQFAQQIVDKYIKSLRDLLPPDIYAQCKEFLESWQKIKLDRFTRKQIIFTEKGNSIATFVGVYQKRTKKQLYLCYKVCKNAFRLAPDIYVVHESSSQSVCWGAVQSSTQTDRLLEVTRGFNINDLKALLEITSVSILDLSMLNELQ